MSRLIILALFCLLTGCVRNMPSDNTPIHPNPNMDDQPKFEAQEFNPFFADGSAMRPPVPGTVARGQLHADLTYYTGINERGDTIMSSPVQLSRELIDRGQERYNIYCTPCHGLTGGAQDIRAIVVQRGLLPPPSYHDDRLRNAGDGYLFWVMTNGKGNMPSYAAQISTADRWAIVAYLRVLQASQAASLKDIPTDVQLDRQGGTL